MGVKLGLSHWGRNIGRRCSRIGCWGYLDLRGTKKQGFEEDYITRNFTISTPNQILFGWSNREEWDGRSMWHVKLTGVVHPEIWWENLRGRHHLEDIHIDVSIILKWIFKNLDVGHGLAWFGSRKGEMGWSCECGNEPSGSIKWGEFLE